MAWDPSGPCSKGLQEENVKLNEEVYFGGDAKSHNPDRPEYLSLSDILRTSLVVQG